MFDWIIFVSYTRYLMQLHDKYPHIKSNEGIALLQRTKNAIIFPEREVYIADLNITEQEAQEICNGILQIIQKEPHWKHWIEMILEVANRTEFRTEVC